MNLGCQKTYTGSEQAKLMGLSKPLYDEFELDEVVKLKGSKRTFKIGFISSKVIVYLYTKNKLDEKFNNELEGPFWCDEIEKIKK